MLIVVVTLSVAVNFYVGNLSLDLFNLARWQGIGIVVCLFLLVSFLLDLFASLAELKNFKDHESGHKTPKLFFYRVMDMILIN